MKSLSGIAKLLVLIGALNWGLVGFLGLNLVEAIFGAGFLTTLVYDLVGLSAVWVAWEMWGGKKK